MAEERAKQEKENNDRLMEIASMMCDANAKLNGKIDEMQKREQEYVTVRDKEVQLLVKMQKEILDMKLDLQIERAEREKAAATLALKTKQAETEQMLNANNKWLDFATHFVALVFGLVFALLLVREFGLGGVAVQSAEL